MNVRAVFLASILCGTTLTSAGAQTTTDIDLHQNWKPEEKEKFWFTPQGSLLLPYAWFLHLKQASSDVPFKDDANMLRLGYVPIGRSTLNPDALPIGFALDRDRSGRQFVGFTCAACHTAVLRIAKTDVLVEGAPALSDFSTFMRDLIVALDATATSSATFATFAKDVLGASHPQEQEDALKKELEAGRRELRRRWLSLPPITPYGPARLDAFGGLFNQVVAYDLDVPVNARVADAPVSYPFLWDTPQHDRVQWNGTAINGQLGGLGSVFRNIGEVLGVFGTVQIEHQSGTPEYLSSVHVDKLKELEEMVRHLRSPMWPSVLGKDAALARTGERVYKDSCARCHAILNPDDMNRKVKAQMIGVRAVGTDPRFAVNYADRFVDGHAAETGTLAGAPKVFGWLFFRRFGTHASGGDIFSNAVLGAYEGRETGTVRISTTPPGNDERAAKQAMRQVSNQSNIGKYKARPLNGIWATAPYLHNGSVPTITELLKPPADRMTTFWIGSHEFDAVNLGLSTEKTDGGFLFDTWEPGNSNQGHEYGTQLDAARKKALIEFLKTL